MFPSPSRLLFIFSFLFLLPITSLFLVDLAQHLRSLVNVWFCEISPIFCRCCNWPTLTLSPQSIDREPGSLEARRGWRFGSTRYEERGMKRKEGVLLTPVRAAWTHRYLTLTHSHTPTRAHELLVLNIYIHICMYIFLIGIWLVSDRNPRFGTIVTNSVNFWYSWEYGILKNDYI